MSAGLANESAMRTIRALSNCTRSRCRAFIIETFSSLLLWVMCLSACAKGAPATNPPPGGSASSSSKPSKFKDFAEVTKDTIRYEGLFQLYRTNEVVYAEIKSSQFDQPFLAPIAIARGLAMAGQPL